MSPSHPTMPFSWNCPNGPGEDFRYFQCISPYIYFWKMTRLFIWANKISFTLELSVPSNIEFGSVAREKVVFFYCHRCIMAFSLIPLRKYITLHLINFKILNQRMFYKGQISLNLIQGFCRRRSLTFSIYFVISLV